VRALTALDRLRGLLAARELIDAEVAGTVRAARAEGAGVWTLALLLGCDRSTLYRRYLSGADGVDEAV
jgi:hypothetical protein